VALENAPKFVKFSKQEGHKYRKNKHKRRELTNMDRHIKLCKTNIIKVIERDNYQ